MNPTLQGHGIVWLVRLLTAIGLLMVAMTIGQVGWTLARVRSERTRATAEQDRLDNISQALRERAVLGRAEIRTILDENAVWTNPPSAAASLQAFVGAELSSQPDPDVLGSLKVLNDQASRLVEFRGRVANWRASYGVVWDDIRQQKTMGRTRTLIAQLRTAVEAREGQRRLDGAIKNRRWREAGGEDAARQAREILLEQGRQQSRDSADFKNQLAELGRLVEVLGGEEQFDSLADLKDNQLKPALDGMSHSITAFGENQAGTDGLTQEAVERLRGALLGEGFTNDEAHQTVQPGLGGLFTLRRDALQLRRERDKLKNEMTALFQNIESANANYAKSADVRTAALSREMERSLETGWRQMLIFAGACLVLFVWIAWRISRGINGQVNSLEQARAEAEEGRQKTHQLMLEQQAVTAQLAAAHQGLEASEQRFRTLCASAPIGIYLTDAEGLCLYTNPHYQRIAGLTLEETLGHGWERALHPEDAAEVVSARDSSAGEGHEFDCEFRFRRDGDEIVWAHARATIMRSEAGKAIGRVGTVEDITGRKRTEAELDKAHKELVEVSRLAGMAEVATGVLHNVGNVLNSVNVASSCVADGIRKSKVASLAKVVVMLGEHEADLGAFLTSDPKGRQIPGYLAQLAEHLSTEQAGALKELAGLQKNIEHIKDIVAMQQSFARVSGATEALCVTDLVEDALKMNSTSLIRHNIAFTRDFQNVPLITVEKHKVLQILVNLVSNAKQACDESGAPEKRLTLRVSNGNDRVRIAVTDNGIGILSENLTRIFAHGFTTKKSGHGFGLHSGALAAKQMGGALTVHSDGLEHGSTFTLELPVNP